MTIVPFEHDTPAWHAMRQRNVGGSEIAALYDCQADYQLSRYALWQVKAGRAPPPPVDNPRTRWGIRLEEVIAAAVAEEHGWTVTKGGYATDETTPGLACSLDFVARRADRPNEPGALEAKNVDWLIHKRTWLDAEPPPHILLQLQEQLAATGFTWGAVACLVGGNELRLYEYEARPKLIADMRRRVREFWQSIADGREPPVDGSDGAAAVIRSLYPETRDELLDLRDDNSLPEICADLLSAGETRREAEKAEKEAKNQIAAKLGGARRAMVQGFWINVAVTPEKQAEPPPEGYLIPGRKEVRRLTVKEMETQQ